MSHPLTFAVGITSKTLRSAGFSLVEVMVTVAVVGVIAGASLQIVRMNRDTVAVEKMAEDVRRLNSAIEIYRTFGGQVDDATTPQEVLRRLKTEADATSREQIAGLAGTMIDRRIEVELLRESELDSSKSRVVWKPALQRFVIVNSNEPGEVQVGRFVLSGDAASGPAETESRSGTMDLALIDGWIWDYDDSGFGGFPNPVPTGIPTAPGTTTGPAPLPPGGPSFPPPPPPSLDRPIFSMPGSTYPASDYDLAVSLIDPNPPADSELWYRVDDGPEILYAGALTVEPGQKILAYARSRDLSAWSDSGPVVNTYEASAITLAVPFITTSAAAFDFGANQSVLVSMTDSNDPSFAMVQYRLDGGSWQDFAGDFALSAFDYPGGADIEARVVGTRPEYAAYFLDSGIVSARIDPAPVGATPFEEVIDSYRNSPLGGYGLFHYGNGKLTISGSSSVVGTVALGADTEPDMHDNVITGTVYIDGADPGLENVDGDGNPVTVVPNTLLGDAAAAATAISALAAALPATEPSVTSIGNGDTIDVSGSDNNFHVYNIGVMLISGGNTATFAGDADDWLILNISEEMTVSGGSNVEITGFAPGHVLFNVTSAGTKRVTLSGGASAFNATILAPNREITLSGGSTISGAIHGGGMKITLGGGAVVTHAGVFGCE